MTSKTKQLSTIAAFLSFFLLALASSSKNSVIRSDSWIPKDFDPKGTVLLVATHPRNKNQNEKMIKYIEKHYAYPFEVVDEDVIRRLEGKYADAHKYRYGFIWKVSTHTFTTADGKQNGAWDMYGYFTDRLKDMFYSQTPKWGQDGYMPVFNSLEKYIKKNNL